MNWKICSVFTLATSFVLISFGCNRGIPPQEFPHSFNDDIKNIEIIYNTGHWNGTTWCPGYPLTKQAELFSQFKAKGFSLDEKVTPKKLIYRGLVVGTIDTTGRFNRAYGPYRVKPS